MSKQFEKLVGLLRELFQLDQPDLDFGIYRIMHAKSEELTQFLERDLLPQVKTAFSQYTSADKAELQAALAKAIEQAAGIGIDPETAPKVKELRHTLANESVDVAALETEVYDHLYSFFRRYYQEGDFLAKRVYKPGVYAIPYEGEEVKLHWANRDQYYIKTSEYLRDYAFTLKPGDAKDPMRVHFRLVDAAEGEHGNVKATEGKDRVFILATEDAIAEESGELVIRFHYRAANVDDWTPEAKASATSAAAKKPPTQKELTATAVATVLAAEDAKLARWLTELNKPHTKATGEQADYTRLQGHLNRYVARNTFDYFIHKDLGGYLRRELDFYIKNEVMHLDDVESETVARVEQYLSKIKVIRKIANKLIDFLAQLEDFQKKLWLKKKFVTQTSYFVALRLIPETLFSEIIANDLQLDEWVRLFGIASLPAELTSIKLGSRPTKEFLIAHPTLTINTALFSSGFTETLLASLADLDAITDGLAVNGDNFDGLRLLSAKHRNQCDVTYIDPPYNTDASAILYKNDYKNSSWMSLIENRVAEALPLMSLDGIMCFAIDDEEVSEARQLLTSVFAKEVGVAVVRSNPQSRKASGTLSPSHEYALFYGRSQGSVPGSLDLTDKRLARYPKQDEKGRYSWMSFIRTGTNDKRADRPKMFYPIFVSERNEIRIPNMKWSDNVGVWGEYIIADDLKPGEVAVLPIADGDNGPVEKRWHRGFERVRAEPEEFRVRREVGGKVLIDFKTRIDEEATPITWWDKNEYASANYGAAELKALFGDKPFDFPKAVTLVADCLKAANVGDKSTVLDYFAGSGTTLHAVINLNREDGGQRKFIVIEVGDHFSKVVLPRTRKVTFTPEWRDGKPARGATEEEVSRSPLLVKVIKLETYEDALNNLLLTRSVGQRDLLAATEASGPDALKEQYTLRYMLDVETRGSPSLLNIAKFADPTVYKLKVKRTGSDETKEVSVDLVETFNFLIGLSVEQFTAPQHLSAEFKRDPENRLLLKSRLKEADRGSWWFRTVTGAIPDGRKTLVIWRKLTGNAEEDNLVLDMWFTKQGYSTKDYEFDLIYVNGDNNLENLRQPDETWKVRLIEEDFHRLMFDTTGL